MKLENKFFSSFEILKATDFHVYIKEMVSVSQKKHIIFFSSWKCIKEHTKICPQRNFIDFVWFKI